MHDADLYKNQVARRAQSFVRSNWFPLDHAVRLVKAAILAAEARAPLAREGMDAHATEAARELLWNALADGAVNSRGILYVPDNHQLLDPIGQEWWLGTWDVRERTLRAIHSERPVYVISWKYNEIARCVTKAPADMGAVETLLSHDESDTMSGMRVVAAVAMIEVNAEGLRQHFQLQARSGDEIAVVRSRGGAPKKHDDELYRRCAIEEIMSRLTGHGEKSAFYNAVSERAVDVAGLAEAPDIKAIERALKARSNKTIVPAKSGEGGKV